jgi:hypothetical protein
MFEIIQWQLYNMLILLCFYHVYGIFISNLYFGAGLVFRVGKTGFMGMCVVDWYYAFSNLHRFR